MDTDYCTEELRQCKNCEARKPLSAFSQSTGYYRWTCKACKSRYSKGHRAAHRERVNASRRAQRAANPEKLSASNKASYRRHRAKRLASARAYLASHHAQIRAYRRTYYLLVGAARQRARLQADPLIGVVAAQKRRARLLAAPVNDFTPAQWHEMQAAYGYRCAYCGAKPVRLTMDHLTPLTKGGAHTKHNIVPACRLCNGQKYVGPVLTPVQPLLL